MVSVQASVARKCNPTKIKVGDYLSETQYYQVLKNSFLGSTIEVKNERGFTFNIAPQIVEEGMYSHDQYDQEEEVTKTKAVEILETTGNTLFTINFNKQLKAKECTKSLNKLLANKDKYQSKKELNAFTKELIKGEERTLIGYLVSTEAKLGRSTVVDLEIPTEQHRLRLIDHRSINWIIFKNVKYTVK